MQEEASTSVASTSVTLDSLPNPFVENSGNFPIQDNTAPRFDFYTDPMAAYSGNRKSNADYQRLGGYSAPPRSNSSHMAPILLYPPGMGNPEMAPAHATQFHTNYVPDQRLYHAPPFYQGFQSHQGPSGMHRPFPNPNVRQFSFPNFNSRQGRGPGPGPNPGRGTNQWLGNTMTPGSGRGEGHPNSRRGRETSHPGLGRSRGRGRGSHDHVTALDRPDRFYHKSMVEDPWKFSEPVLWTQEDISRSPWLPKSVSDMKEG